MFASLSRFPALRTVAAVAALCTACGAAQAQDAREQARQAAISDGLTTAIGLAAGAAELNPLGPLVAVGSKAVLLRYAETLPDTERPAVYALAASLWSGAAANNLCITASVLSGGGFAPACIALGVAWGMKTWKDTERERQFWEGCAMLRQYAGQPDLYCSMEPPEGELVVHEIVAIQVEPPVITVVLASESP